MTAEHRFTLDKSSKKHYCPRCTKKRLVRYVDMQDHEYLPDIYGRCDREADCCYHLNPYVDGYAKAILNQGNVSGLPNSWKPMQKDLLSTPKPINFDFNTFKKTLSNYDQNIFVQNLIQNVAFPFAIDEVTKVIELYRLGTITNGYRSGAITFPFIDIKNNVRAIQVKQFDKTNHTTETDFLHSIIEKHYNRKNEQLPGWLQLYTKQDKKVSCLFGEHILSKYPMNPIALVEAPKTAIYGTLYFGLPNTSEDLIWIAVYNKSSFSFDRLESLKGRDVFVFPDLSLEGNTFKEWEFKAQQFETQMPGTKFNFSDLLEKSASQDDREAGNDFADILIRQDWRLFRKNLEEETSKAEIEENLHEEYSTICSREQDDKQSAKDQYFVGICSRIKEDKESDSDEYVRICSRTNEKEVLRTLYVNSQPAKGFALENGIEVRTGQSYRSRTENNVKKFAEVWCKEIEDLERFYSDFSIPVGIIQLNKCSWVSDVAKFIQSNLLIIKANNGNPIFLPYLKRLQQLKQLLITKY